MSTHPNPSRFRAGWQTLVALVQLGRPKFLLGGLALYGLGALAASVRGFDVDLARYCWGQLAVTSIQLMTHYSNDYFDYHADLANPTPTRWSGGSRVLVRGLLPRPTALSAALCCAALGLGAMIVLGTLLPWPAALLALPVLLAMLVLSWSYSSPPLSLHSRGLGEPAVAIIVPLLTPFSGFVIQAGQFDWFPLLLCAPLALLLMAMLLTLEFPDEVGDRRVGKQSWVVVLGRRRVAQLCSFFTVLGFLVCFLSILLGAPAAVAWAWLLLLPLGMFQVARLWRRDWRRPSAYDRLAFGSVALFFLAVVADLLALARWG